jgi:hypothetical protein
MASQKASISTDQLATMSINLLHRALVEASRTEAKKIFRELDAGGRFALANIKMQDDAQVRFDVVLDRSEFRGELNFSRFREGFLALVADLVPQLQSEEPLHTFVAESVDATSTDDGERLFAARGFTRHGDDVNVLMLAARPEPGHAIVTLRLMYFDAQQFQSSEASS